MRFMVVDGSFGTEYSDNFFKISFKSDFKILDEKVINMLIKLKEKYYFHNFITIYHVSLNKIGI